MAKFTTSKAVENEALAGATGSRTWVKGQNCVYKNPGGYKRYRVSINTRAGWRTLGLFDDLGTASYVANVAILAFAAEEDYQLNEVLSKNGDELQEWRSNSQNSDLESIARRRFAEIDREQREAAEEEQRVESERARAHVEKVAHILSLSNPMLVEFLKTTKKNDPYYKIAMKEAVKRHQKLGLPRAT